MSKACFLTKKRLKGTRLSKRGQALVIEAIVESTALFDSQIRPWHRNEVKRMQQQVDKLYRQVWSSKTKPPLIEMEERGVNMFGVRRKLGVKTLETKITKRVLQRIGHVLRMENGRLTKSAVLGWPKAPRNPNNNLLQFLLHGICHSESSQLI